MGFAEPFLKELGLSDKEILIYLTLLKLGKSSAYDVALKTGIYRPHVYDRLETLIEKGLVSFVQQDKKKYFQAFEPKRILHLLDEKKTTLEQQEQEARKAVQELSALVQFEKDDTRVEVFKGKEGVKALLNDIIETGKENHIMGLDDRYWNDLLPFFMKRYFERINALGIKERCITLKSKDVFLFPGQEHSYRFLDPADLNPVPTLIYGTKVAMIILKPVITVIKITNKELAQTYVAHFEHLWKIADKKRPV